jgi:hypothetical protein
MKTPNPSLFRQIDRQLVLSGSSGQVVRDNAGHVSVNIHVDERTTRKLEAWARAMSVDTDLASYLKWARAILRKAKLPADLRGKKRKDGSGSIPLLDERVVKVGTLEWHAAQVVFYTTSTERHLERSNARDAVWCVTRATEHFWKGWIDEHLAEWLPTGRRVRQSAMRRGEEIRRHAGTYKTVARYSELLAEKPGESGLFYCRRIAGEQGLSVAAVRKRMQRHIVSLKR